METAVSISVSLDDADDAATGATALRRTVDDLQRDLLKGNRNEAFVRAIRRRIAQLLRAAQLLEELARKGGVA